MLSAVDQQLFREIAVLCQKVSTAILPYYYREQEIHISQKENNTPLTNADIIAHELLINELPRIIQLPVLSEESENYSDVTQISSYWLIDPIDGTSSFLNHSGEFCILITQITNHRPVLSFTYIPTNGQYWFAKKDGGAWKSTDQSSPIKISTAKKNEPIRIILPNRNVSKRMKRYLDQHFPQQHRSYLNSGIKFCQLAEGKVDLYPKLSASTNEWDTAAGDLLISEAGGGMRYIDGSFPQYGCKNNPINQPFIAYSQGFSEEEINGYLTSMRYLLSLEEN